MMIYYNKCPGFMAFLKAACSGGKLYESCKRYFVLDMAEVSGVFMGSGFDI